MARRCCCPVVLRDNGGSTMLFPQHQSSNDAVTGLRLNSNKGPTLR
jgi:hypothetical protein